MTKQEISDLRKNKRVDLFCNKTKTWGRVIYNQEHDLKNVFFILMISKDKKTWMDAGDYFHLRDLHIMYNNEE